MATTNAERQAAHKARQKEAIDTLTSTNAELVAINKELQAQVDRLKDKLHKLEIAALKNQITPK